MENSNSNIASEPAMAFKTSVAQSFLVEISEPYLSKAFVRIDELSQLKEDWDGRGALPISKDVLRNIKNVLSISEGADWQNWLIAPDVNATICLQSKKNRASISLGNNEFSYYALIGGKRLGQSHLNFTAESFLSLMRSLDK
ncbi:MAG: hypothetical protein II852_03530 [Bacteroidales bacterium]|nr:hypothetical protein [Bacteroidales bacterium]